MSTIEMGSKQVRPVSRVVPINLIEDGDPGEKASPQVAWRAVLLDELRRSGVRERLARALVGVAWIHLTCFLGCQAVYDPAIRTELRHPLLWVTELVAVLFYLRMSLGRGWHGSSSALNLVAKFWTTFLILSFSLVTLNAITGFELAWYKPVWATLSTFLFASMGWLFSVWFFVPAVQMWATGLLMVRFPEWCFLIYGVSWWVALTSVALWIRPRDGAAK
jgi:hypothetical protein